MPDGKNSNSAQPPPDWSGGGFSLSGETDCANSGIDLLTAYLRHMLSGIRQNSLKHFADSISKKEILMPNTALKTVDLFMIL